MVKNKKGKVNIVYSTNPDFSYEEEENDEIVETLPPAEQKLYVSIDKKQRKGKEVTLIENFIGTAEDLSDLAKKLKNSCGVGGSAKDGVILIQGSHRDKIVGILEKDGYIVKKKGG